MNWWGKLRWPFLVWIRRCPGETQSPRIIWTNGSPGHSNRSLHLVVAVERCAKSWKTIAVDEKFRIHVQKYTLNEYFSGCIGKSASEKQVLIATIKGNLYVYQTVRVAQQSTTYALSPAELMRTSENTELIIPAVQKCLEIKNRRGHPVPNGYFAGQLFLPTRSSARWLS